MTVDLNKDKNYAISQLHSSFELKEKCYKNGKISIRISINGKHIGQIRYYEDGYIAKLAIKPNYRNKGYAKYLLQFVIERLISQCPSVRLHVEIQNEIAIKLYKAMGFFIVLLITDKSHYLMAKQLS